MSPSGRAMIAQARHKKILTPASKTRIFIAILGAQGFQEENEDNPTCMTFSQYLRICSEEEWEEAREGEDATVIALQICLKISS